MNHKSLRLTDLFRLVQAISFALLVACSPRESDGSRTYPSNEVNAKIIFDAVKLPNIAVYSLSISTDGQRVFYIADEGTGNKLFFVDINAVDTRPKQLVVSDSPIEVAAGEGGSFSVVTRRDISSKEAQHRYYSLTKFLNIESSQFQTIIESDIFIGSVVELSDGTYAFQLGVGVLSSGRTVRKFFIKKPDGKLTLLSEKPYGYKVAVSVAQNNLVFLSGEKDLNGIEIPDIISLDRNSELPAFLRTQVSPNLAALACSRSGAQCFSQYRYTAKGQATFSHQLIISIGTEICKPNIPYKWIEFPQISQSGNAIVFLTTEDGTAAPIGSGRRKVIVLKLDKSTCDFQIQQINL